MKSSIFLLILGLFTISTYCLSLKGYPHMQSSQDQQAYLDQLIQIQNSLKSQIVGLEQQVQSVNSKVSSFDAYPNIQTQVLQSVLIDERNQLYNMSSQLILPFNLKKWDCKLLTADELNTINQQISSTQKNIQTLKQKIAAQPDCQRNNEIQLQIQFLNMYINHLATQASSTCAGTTNQTTTNTTTNTTVKTVLVPNSLNQYYVYGTQTQQSYNTNIQNLLDQGYTKLQCPPQTPYPKGNACVGCPQDGLHFYDLTKLVCLTCPAGYIYQPANHTCTTKTINSNPQGQNYVGTLPPAVTGLQTCPLATPFFNGTHCIGCPSPAFFDFSKMVCQTCPANTVFDPSTHLCMYKKFNSNINGNSTNYCCGTLPHDPNAGTCPLQSPFFNGQQCIACQLPAYFSLQSMSCSICPDGQGFSLVQRKCIQSKYLQITYTSAISTNVQNYVGTVPQISQLYEQVASCPADHPFFNGQLCVGCVLPSFYSFDTNQCLSCPAQTKFDVNSKKCVTFSTSQMNNNMVVLNNYIGSIPNFNSQLATCPNDAPFFNGNTCIACPLPNYVDFTTMTCKTCNTNYQFNTYNRQCVVSTPMFYTDPNASNIFYNGDYNVVKQYILALKSQYPNIQQCPADTAYFDATQGQCVKCPSNYPLFDFKYNRCINCAGQSTYDPTTRICVLQGRVSATVERMIMNTIGWT